MPKWIRRWIRRARAKFPDCQVSWSYNPYYLVYEVWLSKEAKSWSIGLVDSSSPSTWQNRRSFRDYFDAKMRYQIDRGLT